MAQLAEVRFRTEAECLEAFARTMGEFPPRQPIPTWWDTIEMAGVSPARLCRAAAEKPPVDAEWYTQFREWFAKVRADPDLRDSADPEATAIGVRLEAFTRYGDEDDEDDADDLFSLAEEVDFQDDGQNEFFDDGPDEFQDDGQNEFLDDGPDEFQDDDPDYL